MKTYIITGGAGFIGSSLARRLVNGKNKVYIIDDLSTGYECNIPAEAIFYKIDISEAEKLFDFKFPNIDVIYHLAAQPSAEVSFDDPSRDIDVNYKATYNILNLARRFNCERFIYASSMSVYGDVEYSDSSVSENYPCAPVSYYGVNKLASEKIIKVFIQKTKIKETILRLFNVYGPGQNMANMRQGMVSIYLSYLMNDLPINVKGSLNRFRDFVYIEDVVDVLIACQDNKNTVGEIFNLGSGTKTTVEQLLKIILKVYGKRDFDKWVNVWGSTKGDIKGFVADINKLNKSLNWLPKYTLIEGIIGMKKWIEEEKPRF